MRSQRVIADKILNKPRFVLVHVSFRLTIWTALDSNERRGQRVDRHESDRAEGSSLSALRYRAYPYLRDTGNASPDTRCPWMFLVRERRGEHAMMNRPYCPALFSERPFPKERVSPARALPFCRAYSHAPRTKCIVLALEKHPAWRGSAICLCLCRWN